MIMNKMRDLECIEYGGYTATVIQYEIPLHFIKVTASALFKENATIAEKLPSNRTCIYMGLGKTFAQTMESAEKKHSERYPNCALIFQTLTPAEMDHLQQSKFGYLFGN